MKTLFAGLRRQAKAAGVTPLPQCPKCEQQVPAKEWTTHVERCTG